MVRTKDDIMCIVSVRICGIEFLTTLRGGMLSRIVYLVQVCVGTE